MLLDTPTAKEVLGYHNDEATDITAMVPNPLEIPLIAQKIRERYPDTRVIAKSDQRDLALFLTVILAFLLLLFHKASALTPHEKKEIGILRAVGWGIGDVIGWKSVEALLVSLLAFFTGFVLAYGFVFVLGAPGLKNLFLGFSNLPVTYGPLPALPLETLSLLFFLSVPPRRAGRHKRHP